jgi:hypothetical protein
VVLVKRLLSPVVRHATTMLGHFVEPTTGGFSRRQVVVAKMNAMHVRSSVS